MSIETGTSAAGVPGPAAELRRVSRLFRSGRGVEDLSFDVRAGETLALLGPAGSGRSTVLRLLAGRVEPGQGEVLLWGGGSRSERRRARRRLAFQLERDAHFEALSGFRNAYFFGSLHRVRREKLLTRIDGLFDELELRVQRDLPVSAWDADARRRLSVLEAVLPEPDMVLLDEPFEGLGYSSAGAVRSVMRRAAARGAAVVYSARRASEVEGLAQRAVLMLRGRSLGVVDLAGLREELGGRSQVTCILGSPVDPAPFRALPGVEQAVADGVTLTLLARGSAGTLDAVVAEVGRQGARLVHLDAREPGLADAYLSRAGRRLEED